MASDSLKSYLFAIVTSLYIGVIIGVGLFLIFHYDIQFNLLAIVIIAIVAFVLSFIIIQFRVQKYIYDRLKKIYDDVTILEGASFPEEKITTDMSTLEKEVQQFAERKKLEIEGLRITEEYRKEFMGNVAHELKTPLFTVQGYILTLLDGAIKDKTVRKKYLQRADKGVERLIYLVNDLDMISKLEAGDLNLDYSYFDIIEVIKNTFDLLDIKAAAKNVTLTFDIDYEGPILVNADEERIQQLLTNLIENSIKYGKDKGTTEISIQNLVENKLLIRVTDNGEGIEEEHLTRLFERFYRVDKSGNRKVGGSGLGLSIVKHIIEAHEEKIYVESEFGVGSEFSFTLEKAEELP
jgi:two-component system phosphate regulon sensor histidine kinase PhoR